MSRTLVGFLSQALLASSQSTPGFQFLGFGYDVLYGNPKSTAGDGDPGFRTNIFKFTKNDGQKTADGKWDLPDKTTSQDFGNSCSLSQTSKIIASTYDYKNSVDDGISLDAGFFGIEFSLSADWKQVEHQTRNQSSVFAQVKATCTAYRLTMHTYSHPDLDDNFVAGVKYLPEEYDEESYMEFLQNFGTHAVTQMEVGGRFGWQMEFSSMNYANMLDNSVDVSAGISYAGEAKAGLNFTHSSDRKSYMSVINAISSNKSFNVGGLGGSGADPSEWMTSAKAYPFPVQLTLKSLSRLLDPLYIPTSEIDNVTLQKKQKAMEKAAESYCAYVQKTDSSVSCEPPQPMPAPTPDPIASNAVRRICVLNDGAYRMNWELHDLTTQYPVTSASGGYDHGSTQCIDGLKVGAARNDILNCRVNRVAGKSEDCHGGNLVYDARSTRQANFRCGGSTFTGSCDFTGFSGLTAGDEVKMAVDVMV